MASEDQSARKLWAAGSPTPDSNASKTVSRIDAAHFKALRRIVATDGLPEASSENPRVTADRN
jgi:hypothetical protein